MEVAWGGSTAVEQCGFCIVIRMRGSGLRVGELCTWLVNKLQPVPSELLAPAVPPGTLPQYLGGEFPAH